MSQFPTCGHGWPLGLHRTLWLLCALSYAHVVLQSPYFFRRLYLFLGRAKHLFEQPTQTRTTEMQNIIDTAVAAGSFKTLAAALTAAGLVDTLNSAGPFTVFAPTDDAFAKLPEGTVDKLLKDVPKLTAILTYHVLSGKVMAADVMKMDGKTAKTVNGADLKITTQGGVNLNGSVHVTKTDIDCSNGVIHVVDAVLMPPA